MCDPGNIIFFSLLIFEHSGNISHLTSMFELGRWSQYVVYLLHSLELRGPPKKLWIAPCKSTMHHILTTVATSDLRVSPCQGGLPSDKSLLGAFKGHCLICFTSMLFLHHFHSSGGPIVGGPGELADHTALVNHMILETHNLQCTTLLTTSVPLLNCLLYPLYCIKLFLFISTLSFLCYFDLP